MTPAEIIKTHAARNGLSAERFAAEIGAFLKLPRAKVVREGDCLFLFRSEGKTANVYVVNGGQSSTGFVRAVREFVKLMQQLEFKTVVTSVNDKERFQRILEGTGVKKVSFSDTGRRLDPYRMTVEL